MKNLDVLIRSTISKEIKKSKVSNTQKAIRKFDNLKKRGFIQEESYNFVNIGSVGMKIFILKDK